MTLTKQEEKEDKEIEDEVGKFRDSFMESVYDIVDDMYFSDMRKQEITKLLIRDLKLGINMEYKILRKNHPNHNPCPICEDRLKQ